VNSNHLRYGNAFGLEMPIEVQESVRLTQIFTERGDASFSILQIHSKILTVSATLRKFLDSFNIGLQRGGFNQRLNHCKQKIVSVHDA
jgi:hypothetical protein